MERGFGQGRRLRARSEFDRVFRKGRRIGGPLFSLIALPNGRSEPRLGIAVGRKVGRAVARNRARRLLRDGFRRLVTEAEAGFDLVIVVRPEMVGRTQAEVDGELTKRFRQLAERRASAAAAH